MFLIHIQQIHLFYFVQVCQILAVTFIRIYFLKAILGNVITDKSIFQNYSIYHRDQSCREHCRNNFFPLFRGSFRKADGGGECFKRFYCYTAPFMSGRLVSSVLYMILNAFWWPSHYSSLSSCFWYFLCSNPSIKPALNKPSSQLSTVSKTASKWLCKSTGSFCCFHAS